MFVELKSGNSAINLDHFYQIYVENIAGKWELKARRMKDNVETSATIFEYKNDESGKKAAIADYKRLLKAIAENKKFWSPFE